MSTAPPRAGFLPLPMLVLLLVLATTPLWLARLGLYQYLALEVMVWMLFALGYNLMLGTTGLPSFGHGAFFGAGAYAFGLLQQRVFANVWFDLGGAIVVTALLGALVGLWRLVHSPFGRVLSAIRQNEVRAAFVGYNVWLYKWLVFTLASAIAGLAGALFAMAQQSAYPNVMSLHSSGFVVMMVLIGGGLVSFWGPVIGAVFFILARDVLGATTETWLLWYGLLFVVMVLWQPEGIAGIWQSWRRRLAASARPGSPVAAGGVAVPLRERALHGPL